MKLLFLIVSLSSISTAVHLRAEMISEVYPGELVRVELISLTREPFAEVQSIEPVNGEIAFKFKQMERRKYSERPYFERVIVTRERKNTEDTGVRTIVPNEYLEGDVEVRENVREIGPLADAEIGYLNRRSRTDAKGILIDTDQLILSEFEDLQRRAITLEFDMDDYETLVVEFTRNELNELFEIHYNIGKSSYPENLHFDGSWSKVRFQPGDVANLTLTVRNSGKQGDVYQILARSMSRWSWLDGRMYYLGDLAPGEERQFTRLFSLPKDLATGDYYLRIGIRDYSGAKQQLPLVLTVAE